MSTDKPTNTSNAITEHSDACDTQIEISDSTVPADDSIVVSLWAAKIPFIGMIADHHWFVIDRGGRQNRWEVWQKPHACSQSWGHLNLNLLPPTAGVGNGEAVLLQQWSADNAITLASRIEQSPEQYPWCHKYRYWPGPNSNTYVQWVLLGEHLLSHRAPGKRYCRMFA